ncbi:hypothetical protein WOLCODRAFT_18230 [Wolfiporia cocos MD-104 SS10]|uniref:Fungal pheromone STE3G-protein-coupled receptor n=1 Tax=Wolfiporia cocos (strain MD-104) TaxID=742152 RepID=A0A2H3JZA1_WOLCO|nr:hypothetical protein WOLCODRAFT_18230 [Wolfiporia cocos MD-104 SS10]
MSSLFQNSYYIGNNFNTILYGVELMLYSMTMIRLLDDHGTRKASKSDNFYKIFSTLLLLLITIYVAVQAIFGEEMWIVNADYPGGSAAYLADYAAVWYQTMGTTASVVLNLLADGYMISRCHTVWNDLRIIVVPCVIYVATLVMGILLLYSSGAPNGDFFTGLAVEFGLSYYSLTIGLNVIVTCLILGRIWYLSSAIHVPQRKKRVNRYASIVIESALPYSVAGVAWLVSYGIESDIQILFLSFYVMFTCVSPQMIVLRVVDGRGWSKDKTIQSLSALQLQNIPPAPDCEDRRSSIHNKSAPSSEHGA